MARTLFLLLLFSHSALAQINFNQSLATYYPFNKIINNSISISTNVIHDSSAQLSQDRLYNSKKILKQEGIISLNKKTSVSAGFLAPDTVCINTPVQVINTSTGASNYYWSFCEGSFSTGPNANNLGNPGGQLNTPVFIDLVKDDNGDYYGFTVNNFPGGLVRLFFGNSLLNTPTAQNLGNLGGAIPNSAEGIQVVKNNNQWIGILVGGDPNGGVIPSVVKIDFGASLANPSPAAINWGNLGNLSYPHDLFVFSENNNWYGYTVNARNNTITRFNFETDFSIPPVATNLGNIGGLDIPVGIGAISNAGNWYMFITNGGNSTLTRLDFGSSLINAPTATNIGNPNNSLNNPRDISFINLCDGIEALSVNGTGNTITKLNFGNNLSGIPACTSLGNLGNLNFPHSISELFRVDNDIYALVPNVNNNSLTRLQFAGCNNISGSTQQNPSPVSYSQPGVYNINLVIDIGLPTQTSYCKQITVLPCLENVSGIINNYTPVLSLNPCDNKITVEDATVFNVGDTVLMIQMKGAVIDSSNTAAFGTITDYKNSGNYEFNYVKNKAGNIIELKNNLTRQYDIPNGKVQLVRVPYYQNVNIASTLTCLPWDGNKGGVLVLNVQDTINLYADIDISGKGFKGGVYNENSVYYCNVDSFLIKNTNGSYGANKGESIFLNNSLPAGRGKAANGGGGGNATNSGGGGGGNGSVGGNGGNQYVGNLCTSGFQNGGIGGNKLLYNNAANKIFLGGGGGAGHGNEVNLGSGGNGGGIAIIISNTIKANNFSINSKGATPVIIPISPNDDGRSGGGAGGTILLDYQFLFDNINVSVSGGKGDDCTATPIVDRHGPGGGGSGGILWVNKPTIENSLALSLNGGMNGVNINIGNDPWGAAPGQNGDSIKNLVIPFDTVPFKPNIDSVRIKDSTTSCSSFDFKGFAYTNTNPITNWQWYFGDGGTANTQNTNHTYSISGTYTVKLVVTDINGCRDSITKNVTAVILDFDFSYQVNACNPFIVQFNGVGTDNQNPFWSFGDGATSSGNINPVHTYASQGNYTVKYSVSNGSCIDTITKIISLSIIPGDIILTHDTTICFGATKQLLTAPALSFCWNPVTYLNDPNSPSPITSTPQNITYYYTAEVTGTNQITNGNFSAGNTGFTSDYTYTTPNLTEGQYYVGINPQAWNVNLSPCTDHTSGNGNMMLVNGSPTAGAKVWSQAITVSPNTNFAFSVWIQSLISVNPANLRFSINNKLVGNNINAGNTACAWSQFYVEWNSGNNTTATITIVNNNTIASGNDFALDDISFAPVFIKRDSVVITVEKPFVRTNNDTAFCSGGLAQLNSTGAANYTWAPATGLSNPNIPNPVASPASTTQYIVTGTTVNGCTARDTIIITVYSLPSITRSNDTTICRNSSVQLFASGGTNYSWSPPVTLNNPNISNPIASPTTNTTYYVIVTDVNNCSKNDSVRINLRPPAVFNISPDVSTCFNTPVQLNASGGNSYSWSPSNFLNNSGVSNPLADPPTTTAFSVKIIETTCNDSTTLTTQVTVLPLPAIQISKSNDIDCSNDVSQLNASGATQYSWSPAVSLNNSNIANPVARPASSTLYTVTGTDLSGCTNSDTISVYVTGINKGGYLMPTAFTPNSDGLNDCYGIKYWGTIQEVDFSIYNRWGQRIFHSTQPGQCWDGIFKGQKQNPDVYVYMIKAKTACDNYVFRKGTFALIR